MCKSSDFSSRRLRSKEVVGVACETGVGGVVCRFVYV